MPGRSTRALFGPAILAASLLVAGVAVPVPVAGQTDDEPVLLRYDLRPGDHLIYQQTLERARHDEGRFANFSYQIEWDSHVLVLGGDSELPAVGFQRNRTGVEVLSFEPHVEGDLAERRKQFEHRLSRIKTQYAEANRMGSDGWPRLPWQARREVFSELLIDRHELESLPEDPVRVGDRWTAASVFQFQFRADAWEELAGERCLRVVAADPARTMTLRYWFCPDSGLMRRVEFNGTNRVASAVNEETLTWELIERRRGEDTAAWLQDAETQRGALAGLAVSDRVSFDPDQLYDLLEDGDDLLRRQILGLAYVKQLPPPDTAALGGLYESEDARVRTLAVRLLESSTASEASDLVGKALKDSDAFVRGAALSWVRSRVPAEIVSQATTPKKSRALLSKAADGPLSRAKRFPLAGIADGVRNGEALNGWACHDQPEWVRTSLEARKFSPQVRGMTARWILRGQYAGWPFIVYVPEDYRGDEPVPLIIYLSGDSGRAMHGVASSVRTAAQNGYLVVIPQANGYWHSKQPPLIMKDLWNTLLSEFNIDTNRVYLTGLSNGGTGAVYFASFWNDRFAAVVPMMGAGIYAPDPDYLRDNPGVSSRNAKLAPPPLTANLTRLPMLFLHGDKDTTIEPKASRDTIAAIRRTARQLQEVAPVELKVLKGRGHDVVLDSDEGRSVKFFQQHARDPFPRAVALQSRSLRFPRRYWVEIEQKGEGLAEVHARIEDNNDIHVHTNDSVERVRLLLRQELLPRPGKVRIFLNDKRVYSGELPHDCMLLQESWAETGDPFRAHSAEIILDIRESTAAVLP